MKKNLALLALGATLLAGCVGPQIGMTGNGDASLSVVAVVQDGRLRTQTISNDLMPYTKSSINHLVFKLYTLDGASESPVLRAGEPMKADVSGEVLDEPVTFKNLHPDTTYRIKAFAYRATGEATDDLISTEDVFSYRDVAVGRSLTPSIVNLPVKLINRLFKATATSSIEFTPGNLTNEDELISVPELLGLTIAGNWDNFTVNGQPSNEFEYIFTSSTSLATVPLAITNNGDHGFMVIDLNNPDVATNRIIVPNGTTGNLTVKASNGSLNVLIHAPLG